MKAFSRKTLAIIIVIIIVGFVGMMLSSFHQNRQVYDEERIAITELTNEKIYYEIKANLELLTDRSLLLADDQTLEALLDKEIGPDDPQTEQELIELIVRYRILFDCDTVFLVSEKTNTYYNDTGLLHSYFESDEDSTWYPELMSQDEDYVLNIDDDMAREGSITLFVNCKIRDDDGNLLGAAGFGVQLDNVYEVLIRNSLYHDMSADLITSDGAISMSSQGEDSIGENYFALYGLESLQAEVAKTEGSQQIFISENDGKRNYVAARNIEGTPWILVSTMSTDVLDESLLRMLAVGAVICAILLGIVVFVILRVTNRYERRISQYEQQIKEQSKVFRNATSNLYENIFHFNVTKNIAADEDTAEFFKAQDHEGEPTYNSSVEMTAKLHVAPEYQDQYREAFSRENVFKMHAAGISSFEAQYPYRTDENSDYYWMLTVAYVYSANIDGDIYLYSYRQNVDDQVRKEHLMQMRAELDGLTGVYNKITAQNLIKDTIESNPDDEFQFILVDVDDFKSFNDEYGHFVGDEVLRTVGGILKESFRKDDVVGRLGGDEFCVFAKVQAGEKLEQRVALLSERLNTEIYEDGKTLSIANSIGVAVGRARKNSFEDYYRSADEALYETKGKGKSSYTVLTKLNED